MVLDDFDLSCKVSVANSNFPIYSSLIFVRSISFLRTVSAIEFTSSRGEVKDFSI